jgi:hypothetical protein
MDGFIASEGWKQVRNIVTTQAGGDYRFPHDQILVVLRGNAYKELKKPEDRELSSLSTTKTYLVWYHHLWTEEELQQKRDKNAKS